MAESAQTAEPQSYSEQGRALAQASGERDADKLAEAIDELVTDVQLDARERIIALLRLLLENDLPARSIQERIYLARRLGDHRARESGVEEDPFDEWASKLADDLLGPTLGGT